MDETQRENRYISPGTRGRHDGLSEADGGPEYGVVIHCWEDDEIGAFDCYVAFFGRAFPSAKPEEKPYVLRYAANSLHVLGGTT
jgi:hypothetical protein